MATYGISTWITALLAPEQAAAALAAGGFRRVEISGAIGSPVVEAFEQDPVALTHRFNCCGLTVASVHSPVAGRCLDLPNDADRLASVEANLRYLDLMSRCGVPEVIIHPNSTDALPAGAERAATIARVSDSLQRLAEPAAALGLRLAVENLFGLFSTMSSLLDLIAPFGDHVGLCHDLGHSVQSGLNPLTETRLALHSGRLFSLHIHDVTAAGADHFIPGEGVVELDGLVAKLDESNFVGLRTLEIARADEQIEQRVLQAGAVRARWTDSSPSEGCNHV